MAKGKPDANWWSFSIDAEERGRKIVRDASAGTVEVNPAADGLRTLSYHKYLGLDELLACQVPSSRAPDERIFIITHQLFELVFKQMVFDLRVMAETFRLLLGKSDADFSGLAGLRKAGSGDEGAGFWGPSLTAAVRLNHSAGDVLPQLMSYLGDNEIFSNEEFAKKFRGNLSPASGFQSAQYRLIQRAFGKSRLLAVRLFPADTYLKAYRGKSDAEVAQIIRTSAGAGLVSVVDRLVLREIAAVATPPAGSPWAPVAELDDLAHQVLARVALLARAGGTDGGGALLPDADKTEMERKFKKLLHDAAVKGEPAQKQSPAVTEGERVMIERRAAVFRKDWIKAVDAENRRRGQYGTACEGGAWLLREQPEGRLASILLKLSKADDDLYGKFLLFHQNVVARRIGTVPGTAGGGVPYLDFSRELLGRFPALALFREARRGRREEMTPEIE